MALLDKASQAQSHDVATKFSIRVTLEGRRQRTDWRAKCQYMSSPISNPTSRLRGGHAHGLTA